MTLANSIYRLTLKLVGYINKPSILSPLLLVVLMFLTISLRFVDLGYSDYISDEPGAFLYRGGKKNPEMSPWEFLLSQRKGPMQIFVTAVPYSIIKTYDNELIYRIPFAFFSVSAIYIFYKLIFRLTNSSVLAFVSAFLLSVNGLIVGYGRVVQYQNLVLFFDFAALYYFSFLLGSPGQGAPRLPWKFLIRTTVVGSVLFGFSVLSHWYGVFIAIPIFIFFLVFLSNRGYSVKHKLGLLGISVVTFLASTLPFLVPYYNYYRTVGAESNQKYANRIIGTGSSLSERADLDQFLLYNPFLTFDVYKYGVAVGVFLFFGALFYKIWKHQRFSQMDYLVGASVIWFFSLFAFFRYFVSYSGLHFYNLFPPLSIICGYALWKIGSNFPKLLKLLLLILTSLLFSFLFYQSYVLFVDHKVEYPWERETILKWKTQKYSHDFNLRHETGFPHKRYWKAINAYITQQNELRGYAYGYTTNEDFAQVKFYMRLDHRKDNGFYAVGVKRPYSFATDYKFPQIKGKHTVHKIRDSNGETVVNIYIVDDVSTE